MNHIDDARAGHPDELLAGYEDGTLSPEEVAAVEAHLSTCEGCLTDLHLARAGRTAMAALPEVEAPGIAAGGLAGLGLATGGDGAETENDLVRAGRKRRAPRRGEQDPDRVRRVNWAPAVAVAAAVTVLAGGFAVVSKLGGGGSATTSRAAQTPPAAEAGGTPPIVDRGKDYSQQSLVTLADGLRLDVREGKSATDRALGAATSPPAAGGSGPSPAPNASPGVDVLSCVVQGGGLTGEDVPLYLEVATFEGAPAFVGAFRTPGTNPHLIVAAVGTQSCNLLYEVNLPL